ncbi:MAG: hypothetical protein LUI08_00690 [Prevotella sp.]|nr:hypothetical protein [Prevotella sp.]
MKKTLLLILAAVFSLSMYADDAVYTSNVTWTLGTQAYDDTASINGTDYEILKLGASGKVGDASCTLPAGTTSFVFYVVAWNNASDAAVKITIGTTEYTFSATANSGLSGNSPFTLDGTDFSSDYHEITLTEALTEETTLKVETTDTSSPRIGVFGANYAPYTATDEGNTGDENTDDENTDDEEEIVIETDASDPYVTTVTWTAGDNADAGEVAGIGDKYYELLKLGTSSKLGSATCTLPAGTTAFAFYAVAWKDKGDAPYTITLDGIGEKSYTANADSGVHDSTPFTLEGTDFTSDYHVITFDALSAETTLTIETTSTSLARIVVFGAKYYDSTTEMSGDALDELTEDEGYTATGSGTVDDPYTVADALAIADAGDYTSDNVYVKGYVISISELSTDYGNATYYIADDASETDSGNQLEIYRGYSLGGEKFTSEDELSDGDLVVVCGQLTVYNGIIEITTGSSIYSINGETVAEEEVDMSDPYTSNTTWTTIEHADNNDKAIIGDNEYLLVKLGTSSAAGSAYTTLPAGATKFVFYAVCWGTKSDTPYTVTLEGGDDNEYTANPNSGMHDNSPFTIAVDELTEDDYHEITFDALTEDTKLTVATSESSNGRIGIFGAKYYTETTGIHAVEAATVAGNGAMYNLSGQKVTESYRGIVIVDGKKVLNK